MRYIIYNAAGRICGEGNCNAADEINVPPGCSWLEHDTARPETHWVNNGIAVEYSEAGKVALAARPGPGFEWSPAAESWIDVRPLADAQSAAWLAIKRRRETAFAARAVSSTSVAYSIAADKANLADRLASLQASIAIGAADSTTAITWRDRDDAEHSLTIAGLNLLAAEMGARGQAIFDRSWVLDGQIKAATTRAELDAIDINSGWPV